MPMRLSVQHNTQLKFFPEHIIIFVSEKLIRVILNIIITCRKSIPKCIKFIKCLSFIIIFNILYIPLIEIGLDISIYNSIYLQKKIIFYCIKNEI